MDANLKDEWSNDTLGPFGEQNTNVKPPFKVYIYPNLLEDQIVGELRDDINSSIKLRPKDNDLYKFKQSKDFKTEIPAKKLTPLLHDFIDLMLGKIRQRLEKVTGKKLSNKNFDITASRYDVGNYLLCHNDDIKDNLRRHARSLAFIYYLNSRPWTRDDGGALILFESDKAGEPVKINNSILPRPNTLVVFETTATSWHSVEEVYCKDDFRLSINGWFHTDDVQPTPSVMADELDRIIEPCPYKFLKPIGVDERIERIFKEYFNQDYLMEKTCLLIRKRFKRKSEINLTNFLVKEKFNEISTALREATMVEENLVHVGPYNKRNYRRLRVDKLPPICKDLYDAFQSELFFLLLSRLTGLDLQPPSIKPDQEEEGASCNDDDDDDDDDDEDEDEDEEDEENSDEESDDEESDDEDEDEEDEEPVVEEPKTSATSVNNVSKNDQKCGEPIESGADEESHLVSKSKDEVKVEEAKASSFSNQGTTSASEHQVKEEPTTSKEKLLEQVRNQLPRKRRKISDPLARIEFRHLESGSYTLIHDHGFELGEKSALDVMLHFNHNFAVNFDDGGYISYIDGAPDTDLHDMDYELLTVEPKSNCLSLVYRCDEGTCRFLKYISKTHMSNYQDISCVFYERPEDIPPTSEEDPKLP